MARLASLVSRSSNPGVCTTTDAEMARTRYAVLAELRRKKVRWPRFELAKMFRACGLTPFGRSGLQLVCSNLAARTAADAVVARTRYAVLAELRRKKVRWPRFELGLGPWQGPVIPLHHQRPVAVQPTAMDNKNVANVGCESFTSVILLPIRASTLAQGLAGVNPQSLSVTTPSHWVAPN